MRMQGIDLDTTPSLVPAFQTARPKTLTVVALLAGVALIFSYLIAYAMVNALVAAEVIKRWPAGSDPRFRWFIVTFGILMTVFLGIGALARHSTRRQMRRMEALEREAESPVQV
jgi:hypothetical protein